MWRRTATLKTLARREAVLISVLVAAGAVAALAGPLGAPWLRTVGLVIAAAGAAARTVVAAHRARIERRRERIEAGRRLLVPPGPMASIDPLPIGVDPAAQTILSGDRVPDYVSRQIDGALQEAITAAIEGTGRWFVVVIGASKVGKSRSLFEALRRCPTAAGLQLIAPLDYAALITLLNPEYGVIPMDPAVLWLNDLEPFMNQGLTLQILREWRNDRPGRIVVGIYGGKGGGPHAESSSNDLDTISTSILGQAEEIPMVHTTDAELEPLRDKVSAAELEAIRQHGLAAYLVAGPILRRKLASGRHPYGDQPCPEGVAVVHAATDWARCGRTDPISDDILRNLWPNYLPGGESQNTDEGFATGLGWAMRPVAATIALLRQEIGGYQAYDYVVRLMGDRVDAVLPGDQAWRVAIETSSDAQTLAVALAAYDGAQFEEAAAALARAAKSAISTVAATAMCNHGVVLGRMGRWGEAVEVYDQVVERFGAATEPELREQVAGALVNKGVSLGELGRQGEAVEVCDQVVELFGAATEPELRERVAGALVNKGVDLGELGRWGEAVEVCDQVVERFGAATEPELRERVAGALVNKGVDLGELGRWGEAVEVYDQVVERFGAATEPKQREQVARVLFNKGVALRELGRRGEAIEVYDQVMERFGAATEPKQREQVARVLVNKGVSLGELGRRGEAIEVYDQVVERFGAATEPELRERVARALFNKVVDLGELGRWGEAIEVCDQVVERFGADTEPEQREQVARVLVNKGAALGELGRWGEAVEVYDQVVERFGADTEPEQREQVARALVNKGAALGELGRWGEAMEVCDQVMERFGADTEPGIREVIQIAIELRKESREAGC